MATSCTIRECHHSLLGAAAGQLVLRVRGGEHAGKVLHLRSPKCTIGSDPHATLRLRADGVRPVHCQILRGEQGTFVRRWSSGTLLNGSGFEFRRLKAGDQLGIGHIELDVLEPTALESDVELEPRGSMSSGSLDETRLPDPRIAEQQAVISGLRDKLAQQHTQFVEAELRQAELAEAIAAANLRADDLEGQFAEQETSARDKTAKADDAALQYECRVEELNDELAAVQLRLSDWQRESNDTTGQLSGEIEEARQEHRRVRDEWHTDRDDLRRELAARTESLQKKESEHRQLMDEAEHLIHSLQHEGKQLLAQLSEAKQAIRQNTEDRKRLEATAIPLGKSVESSRPTAANVDSSLNGPQPTVVAPSGSSANDSPPDSPAIGEIAKDVDEDGYIDDYMQRLLGRVDADPQDGRVATEPAEIISPEVNEISPEDGGCEGLSVLENDSTDVVPPSPQQAAGPAVTPAITNMDALRELANCSTRSAINTSQRRQSIVSAIGQMGIAATSSIFGLAAMALSPELISGTAMAGVIGLAFGLNRAWRATKLWRQARGCRSPVAPQPESAKQD